MGHKCPVCGKTVITSVQRQAHEQGVLPFCSDQCKLVDLGAWLDAEYRIVSGPQPEQSTEPANAHESPSDDS